MKIDEPDTPWASPPKELFEDPDGGDGGVGGAPPSVVGVAMDDVAERLKEIERDGAGAVGVSGAGSGAGSGVVEGASRDGWESSDDEDTSAEAEARRARRPKLRFPDPLQQPADGDAGASGGGSTSGGRNGDGDGDGDEDPLDEMDKLLKARLFEAQRKSHQCTFRGVMAQGRALLDREDEEDACGMDE